MLNLERTQRRRPAPKSVKRPHFLAALAWLVIQPAFAQDATELLREFRCYICHADDEAKAGPAFADVAAWYKRRPDPVARLVTVIRSGKSSGGPWHMPPHPEVSLAQARVMARYILSVPQAPPTAR